MATQTELAYIAGFIDGEGCLYIGRQGLRGRRKTTEYYAKLIIANTDLSILRWIQLISGGSIHKTVSRHENRKDCYTLYLSTAAENKLLNKIYPYLQLKRPQANLFKEFSELRKLYPKPSLGRYGTKTSSKEYLDLQEECYQKSKILNKKGPLNNGNTGI